MAVFKILYWAGMVLEIIIRAPFRKSWQSSPKKTERLEKRTENVVLSLLWVGSFVLPLIYSVTDWLGFADYHLPPWMGWLGVFFLAAALYVFWRAHQDLRSNWTPTLEIFEGHTLVTNGIYGSIRHPMYLSQWLMVIAQLLLLQNWIAGLAGLVVFIPFYLLRVPAEEKMMAETFGGAYLEYMQKTGGVIPKF